MAHPLIPLLILFIVICVAGFVGYVVYSIANDIADKTAKKMDKHNVSFGKEGMKIGVKQVKDEDYVAQTQRLVRFGSCATERDRWDLTGRSARAWACKIGTGKLGRWNSTIRAHND